VYDEFTWPTEDDFRSWAEQNSHTDASQDQRCDPSQPAVPTEGGDEPTPGLPASTERMVDRFPILPAAHLAALSAGIVTALAVSALTGWRLGALAVVAGAAGGVIGLYVLMVEEWVRARGAQRRETQR